MRENALGTGREASPSPADAPGSPGAQPWKRGFGLLQAVLAEYSPSLGASHWGGRRPRSRPGVRSRRRRPDAVRNLLCTSDADRRLRDHRRHADARARRVERFDRLALLSQLRLWCVLRRPARLAVEWSLAH